MSRNHTAVRATDTSEQILASASADGTVRLWNVLGSTTSDDDSHDKISGGAGNVTGLLAILGLPTPDLQADVTTIVRHIAVNVASNVG